MSETPDQLLAHVRAQGAHLRDPVRFHYLEALARRLSMQPDAVKQMLTTRLEGAIAAYLKDEAAFAAASPPPASIMDAAPLRQLNRYLADQTRAGAEPLPGTEANPTPDMKSVRRFGEAWSKIAAEQQLARAVQRAPDNAGPLNSHKLMLRSLTLMQSLSPDYLHRFLSQMEALLWLDQLGQQLTLKDGKKEARPARRAKLKK